jgi:transposase-like protein
MAKKRAARIFSRELKLAALSRMLGGENVSALARELGFRRKLLYKWRDQFRSGGPDALRARSAAQAAIAGSGACASAA